jgi:hypothetical protein
MSSSYNAAPDRAVAAAKVNAPAIALMVTGGLGIACQLLAIVLNLLGTSINMAELTGRQPPGGEQFAHFLSGGIGVVVSLLFAALHGLVVFGAMKMRALQSYGLALAGAIASVIPCTWPCCCAISLPFGIWAIVVLIDKNVKASFVQ